MTQIRVNSALPVSASDSRFVDPIGISLLGTAIIDDITFPAGSYFTLQGVQVEFPELSLDSVQFNVSRAKNIVRTAVNGRNGLVKEYNYTGDFIIQGTANLVDGSGGYPLDLVRAWAQIDQVPEAIPILSKVLNISFEIDQVVVSSWRINPGNAAGSAVVLDFALESDRDFDLSDFIIVQR